jgi:hypothetical protein
MKYIEGFRVMRLVHLFLSFCVFIIIQTPAHAFESSKINKVFFSEWVQYSTQTEDGRKINQAQVAADDPIILEDGSKKQLIFAIECRGDVSTAALVLHGSKLEIDTPSTIIELQGDREKKVQIEFKPTANKKSLMIHDSQKTINFVQGLYDKSILYVSAGLTSPETIKAEFDIGRIEKAVEPIAEACNWPKAK